MGLAYLQKARETSNPAFYSRADAFEHALDQDGDDADAMVAARLLHCRGTKRVCSYFERPRSDSNGRPAD